MGNQYEIKDFPIPLDGVVVRIMTKNHISFPIQV